ncbi:anaphase-promoting complex subunit 10-like isoform X1 [Branchiostoma lanceolatum]
MFEALLPFTRHVSTEPAFKTAMATKTDTSQDPTKLERMGKVREIGDLAVWSVSSCKPGFGVDQLRDGSLDTYWQSDGPQPHLVNIQFRKKTAVKSLCLYADYKSDESYTPNRISIRTGTHFHDLQEVEQVELSEPTGWVIIPVQDKSLQPQRTFMIQIAVLSNHQNGRDTHMRQIKIHAPVEDGPMSKFPKFSSLDCKMHSCIR